MQEMRCLVVDDSELNLEMTMEIVSACGLSASGVLSGEEALQKLTAEEFPLVLMDYRMPGIDGMECTVIIRGMQKEGVLPENIKIFGLSGDTDDETVERLKTAGMDAVLAKPLQANELLALLDFKDGAVAAPASGVSDALKEILMGTHFNPAEGLKYSGSEQLYTRFLEHFARGAFEKIQYLKDCLEAEDLQRFTMEVHTLKSTSRTLGNSILSQLSAALEAAGDELNMEEIMMQFPSLLQEYEASATQLVEKLINPERRKERRMPLAGEVEEIMEAMQEALQAFDVDSADRAYHALQQLKLPQKAQEMMDGLATCLMEVDFDETKRVLDKLAETLAL